MFFWISVYAVCVICLALDFMFVRKTDSDLCAIDQNRDQRIVCLAAVSILALIFLT